MGTPPWWKEKVMVYILLYLTISMLHDAGYSPRSISLHLSESSEERSLLGAELSRRLDLEMHYVVTLPVAIHSLQALAGQRHPRVGARPLGNLTTRNRNYHQILNSSILNTSKQTFIGQQPIPIPKTESRAINNVAQVEKINIYKITEQAQVNYTRHSNQSQKQTPVLQHHTQQ